MGVLRSSLILTAATVMAAGSAALAAGAAATTAAAGSRVDRPMAQRPPARFLTEARDALVNYLHDNHPQVELVHPGLAHSSPAGTSAATSFNWSGYADSATTSGTFTRVSGHWITPKVTCTSEDTISSEWVGIDGWSDTTVEQDGTLGWCFEGRATYYTWYEMYPAGTVTVGTTLRPGDKITATVSRTGTAYKLALTDWTRPADSFAKTATCALATCLDTSVEWIEERPAFSIGVAPLADFAIWKLSGGAETASGKAGTISSYATNFRTNMVDATNHYQLSSTSALTGGTSFVTTWRNSY
jgi:Peptidase A4 family